MSDVSPDASSLTITLRPPSVGRISTQYRSERSIIGWERPIDALTIKSEVIGDFHEPYGATRGLDIKDFSPFFFVFSKLSDKAYSQTAEGDYLKLIETRLLRKALGSFCYSVVKSLQGYCNHQELART
jgi:hypothetical protein